MKLEYLEKLDRSTLLDLLDLTHRFAGHEEGKLYIYEPTSEVVYKFHQSKARSKSLIGGNRSGKSATLTVEACIAASGIIPKSLEGIYPKEYIRLPAYVRLCAVDYDNGVYKILWPKVMEWLPNDLIESENKSLNIIRLKNGSEIEFMSYAQPTEKFGGTARDFVGFDEIPPPDVVRENVMRTIDRGGRVMYSFTPVIHMKDNRGRVTNNALSISTYYDSTYLRARRIVDDKSDVINERGLPWIEVFHINVYNNQHVNLEILRQEEQGMTEQERLIRVEGRFQHLAGMVYGENYDEKVHVVNSVPTDPNWPTYVFIDPHPQIPHHVSWVLVDPHGRKFVVDELKVKGGSGDLASAMLALEASRGYWVVWRAIDPLAFTPDMTTGKSLAQDLAELGLEVRPGSKDKYTGIYRTKEALDGRELFFFDRCEGHRWEITHYIWAGDDPLKKNDHYMENVRRAMTAELPFIDRAEYLMSVGRAPRVRLLG